MLSSIEASDTLAWTAPTSRVKAPVICWRTPHEIVNLRAVALGEAPALPAAELPKGDGDPSHARIRDHTLWMDGREQAAAIYDRSRLLQGDTIAGPAIVTEMDSTTLIESGCVATVDRVGNILINPA